MATRKGCRTGAGCLVVLLLVAVGAWLAREEIGGWVGRLDPGATAEPSESLAREAEEKLDRLAREGLDEGEVRFTEAELQSLLTYRGGPALPPGIEDPHLDIQDTILVLSARMHPDRLEGFAGPGVLGEMMGDTSRVVAGVVPVVDAPGRVLVQVRSLQVGSFVLPPMMIPAVVRSLEAQAVPTRGGAIVVRAPPGVATVRLDGDDLVLAADGADAAAESAVPD